MVTWWGGERDATEEKPGRLPSQLKARVEICSLLSSKEILPQVPFSVLPLQQSHLNHHTAFPWFESTMLLTIEMYLIPSWPKVQLSPPKFLLLPMCS